MSAPIKRREYPEEVRGEASSAPPPKKSTWQKAKAAATKTGEVAKSSVKSSVRVSGRGLRSSVAPANAILPPVLQATSTAGKAVSITASDTYVDGQFPAPFNVVAKATARVAIEGSCDYAKANAIGSVNSVTGKVEKVANSSINI